MAANSTEHREVVLKMDGEGDPNSRNIEPTNAGKIWRESSYDFWNGKDKDKLLVDNGSENFGFDFSQINATASGSAAASSSTEDPPSKLIVVVHRNLAPVSESPTTVNRVSFGPNQLGSSESVRRRHQYKDSPSKKKEIALVEGEDKVETDGPTATASGKIGESGGRSGHLKSGFIGKGSVIDEEEDDPLLEEDMPEEYKKDKLDIWILLQWVSLILIIAALVCSLVIPYLRNKSVWKLSLWKWEVFVLVLICGRLVSGWVIRIIVFFVERNFLLRKRVLYFVYGIKKAVQNCLWLGLVLIAWHYLFDKKVQRETRSRTLRYVTKILVFVGGYIVMACEDSCGQGAGIFFSYEEEEEKIAAEIQTLQNAGATMPANLKATTYPSPQAQGVKALGSGRIQKSPRIGTPRLSRAFSKKANEEEDGITIDHLHKLNPKNVSAWNMKRLMNIIRYGALTTLDEQIRDTSQDDDDATKIRSEYEAKAAQGKFSRMWQSQGLVTDLYFHGVMFIRFNYLWSILSSAFFEVNAFRERRALALTLNDTKTAVNKLHRMVNVLVGILIAIIWLLILGIATSKFLVFISSQLLLVAFIFGNTCKTVFESIIFLFVIHPFDVGDRCEVDGVQMVVEEMNILTTVFLRYDNQKIIISNSVLATKAISNYYRSPDMGDAVEFLIHLATPAEKIAVIKQRITCYVENKKEHWYPSPMIIFKDVEDLNRVRIAVWELDIQYRLLPLDINVRALPPVSSERVPPSWMI
ncbi:hypothetical protein GH714_026351 [Hevea brasiliensis]|uniref:Mechanosensitive ion channel protein n=1 Tax=Hevea brasiliensis TaxID=3981 RepID=A0A6A6ML17_HEVBR|nr:hypothetical protein GH714_026351 [Hevea brasiliensis]